MVGQFDLRNFERRVAAALNSKIKHPWPKLVGTRYNVRRLLAKELRKAHGSSWASDAAIVAGP